MFDSSKNVVVAYDKGYRVDNNGCVISPFGMIRKTQCSTNGYLKFNIANGSIDGKQILLNIYVHRLSAYCKYGESIFKFPLVRHKDDDRHNNSPSNLLLGTHLDNMNDKPKDRRNNMTDEQRLLGFCLSKNHNRKFDIHDINKIHKLFKNGLTKLKISNIMGCSDGTISNIIKYGYVPKIDNDDLTKEFYLTNGKPLERKVYYR